MRVTRYDQGEFRGHTRLPTGGLRIAAALTRTGVFEYSDGTKTWREYRPDAEVFAPAWLASMRAAPVTIDHPAAPVTTKSWKALAVGNVGDDVRREDSHVVGSLIVQDADAVAAIEKGELVEISLGYDCEIEWTPGTSPEGEPYDAIQHDLTGNHCALGGKGFGRAGPTVALRMDGAAVRVLRPINERTTNPRADAREEKPSMATIKVRGREYKTDSPDEMKAAQDAMAEVEKKADDAGEMAAKLTAAEEALQAAMAQIADLKAKLAAPVTVTEEMVPADVADSLVTKREALRADAALALGVDAATLKGKSAADLQRAVIAHHAPEMKLDGLSAAVIDGMYGLAVAAAKRNDAAKQKADGEQRNDKLAAAGAAGTTPATENNRNDGGAQDDDGDPKRAMEQRTAARWKGKE